jgi:hypothetical protein
MANGNGNGKGTAISTAGASEAEEKATDETAMEKKPPQVVIDFGKPQPPAPRVERSIIPAVVTLGGVAAIGGAALYYYKKGQTAEPGNTGVAPPNPPVPNGSSDPAPAPAPTPAPPAPAPPAPAPAPAPAPSPTPGKNWGSTNRGEQYRALLVKLEELTGMPLAVFLTVVANRESDFSRTARNKSAVETAASNTGIVSGVKRGNPKPKFADSIAASGSGGLYGALAPYVAWTGMDEGYMPYLNEDWNIIENPIVAVVCAAKYYQRIVTYYPTVFANGKGSPSPEDNFRVRLGWANPSRLKEDPAGSLFQQVRARMEEDLGELGLKISDLPPPQRKPLTAPILTV